MVFKRVLSNNIAPSHVIENGVQYKYLHTLLTTSCRADFWMRVGLWTTISKKSNIDIFAVFEDRAGQGLLLAYLKNDMT